jgi:hypothetical protein
LETFSRSGAIGRVKSTTTRARDSFQHAIDLVKFIRNSTNRGRIADRRGVLGSAWPGFPKDISATPNRLLENGSPQSESSALAPTTSSHNYFSIIRDFYDFRDTLCTCRHPRPDLLLGDNADYRPVSECKRIAELAGGARFPG